MSLSRFMGQPITDGEAEELGLIARCHDCGDQFMPDELHDELCEGCEDHRDSV